MLDVDDIAEIIKTQHPHDSFELFTATIFMRGVNDGNINLDYCTPCYIDANGKIQELWTTEELCHTKPHYPYIAAFHK